MLDVAQLRTNVIRPVLQAIGAHSNAAENLVLGTAVQESNLHYLRQLADGPARGIYQMEPATHDDIRENYLAFRGELAGRVDAYLAPDQDPHDQLLWNLAYATAMCRVHYMRVPAALPAADDVPGLAAYWKQYYNTPQGAGTPAEFEDKFQRYVIENGDALV